MKFPYGDSDFYQIILQGYHYIDRTDRIPLIEEAGKSLVWLRPRRFGKSLLLSMLENYYDVAKADDFTRLFGDLSIGSKPTELHNHFLILTWTSQNQKDDPRRYTKTHEEKVEFAFYLWKF